MPEAGGIRARAAAIWTLARAAWARYSRDDGGALAGYIAYSSFLSLFPFAIFMSALSGVLIGRDGAAAVIDALFQLAPEHIALTLEPVLSDVIGRSREGVLTLSAVGALWAASNAVEALRTALDRAYETPEDRGFILRRALGLGVVLLAAVVFAALGLMIIGAPLGLHLAEDWIGYRAPAGFGAMRYLAGLSVFALFLLVLNIWLPAHAPHWRRLLPGVIVATLLWTIGASLFSVYLAYAPSYSVTYGAFSGVIVTLLFFYLTGVAVIFGAEVNAALISADGGGVTRWR